MNSFTKKIFLFLLGIIIVLFPIFSFSSDVPTLTTFVTDNAKILTNDQKNTLEKTLKDFEINTTNQIVVLTVDNLGGDSIENYSIEVAKKNNVGQKEKNNGILIVISKEDRTIRIEVGYGLEEFLTDAKSSYIIRNIITPEFKINNYYSGISKGIEEIKKVIGDKNYLNEESKNQNNIEQGIKIFSFFFNSIFPLIMFVIIISILKHKSKTMNGVNGINGMTGKDDFWKWLFIANIFFGNDRRRGGKGGFGGFGGSGFGGGGFSGGGGGFGGGGASGHW